MIFVLVRMADDVNYGDAAGYVNDQTIEMAWAQKAYERAEVHMNLITSVDTLSLRLHKDQDVIYREFRKSFPDMGVQTVTEVELKGDNKPTWNAFCELFKEFEDYNLGSLMRIDASKAYSQENTIIVPKIIHLAIEGARNLEGVNERNKASYAEDHKKQME